MFLSLIFLLFFVTFSVFFVVVQSLSLLSLFRVVFSTTIFRGSNFERENSSSLSESELLKELLLLDEDELLLLETSSISSVFSYLGGYHIVGSVNGGRRVWEDFDWGFKPNARMSRVWLDFNPRGRSKLIGT